VWSGSQPGTLSLSRIKSTYFCIKQGVWFNTKKRIRMCVKIHQHWMNSAKRDGGWVSWDVTTVNCHVGNVDKSLEFYRQGRSC